MAPYFAFADEIASWLTRHGVPAADARRYVATIFQGLGNIAVATPETTVVSQLALTGSRDDIRSTTVQKVLELTRTLL